MILFCDANAIWRFKIAEALGHHRRVVALCPRSWGRPAPLRPPSVDGLSIVDFGLPRGWASALAKPVQTGLCTWIRRKFRDAMIEAVVITTPHYLPLAQRLAERFRVFYYASDDYRSYDGWDPVRMADNERAIVQLATHAFFVSRPLADRAVREYGVPPSRVSVSMNATEERFLADFGEAPLPTGMEVLKRPVVGVVGTVGPRLDLDLLHRVAASPRVGTLLFVGPVDRAVEGDRTFRRLKARTNVQFVGMQPHETLHCWTRNIDLGLIPYRSSQFNEFCSPMRLFDHLASGRPVVATSATRQAPELAPWVHTSDAERLPALVESLLRAAPIQPMIAQIEFSKQHLWSARAAAMWRKIRACGQAGEVRKISPTRCDRTT